MNIPRPRLSRSLPAHLLALAATAGTLGTFDPRLAHASPDGVAGGVTVGLLGMDGANAPAAMGPAVTEALRRAIPKFASVRIEMSQQDPAEIKLVFGCTDERPDCMAKVGKSLSVGRLIYGSLRKQLGTGVYTVTLKQLNVTDGTVEKFITETVPMAVLTPGNAELDALVEKWLKSLLIESGRGGLRVQSEPPGATVQVDGATVGTAPITLNELEVGSHQVRLEQFAHLPVVHTVTIRSGLVHELSVQLPLLHPVAGQTAETASRSSVSRGLRYTSYVLYGLAAVSGLAAIGTWRSYVGSEDVATVHLDQLQRDLTTQGTIGTYRDFFTSSPQLSSCRGPAGLAGNVNYQGYLSECQSGNTMAAASTGLWITTAGLVALGISSSIVSAVLRRSELKVQVEGPKPAPTGEPLEITPPPPPRVQLEGVAPVVTPTGGGAVMSLRF